MKTSDRYRVRAGKIRSLKDLELEKERLRNEILRKEQNIHSGYRNIMNALTPGNILASAAGRISAKPGLIAKVIDLGTAFLAKRKKKKHRKRHDQSDQVQS